MDMDNTGRWLRRIYISEIVSNIGSRMTSVALVYLLYRQTGKGSNLGFYFMLITLPGILFANPFGCLADRFDRKSLLVYADSTRAGILAFMAFFIPPERTTLLLAFAFLSQIFRTLYDTSITPLASDLTRDEGRLVKATANLKIIFHTSYIFGLGVGGFAAAYFRPQYIFMMDAGTFVFSACLINSIPIEKKAPSGYRLLAAEMVTPKYYLRWFHLVRDGFKMVWRHEYCKTIILLELTRDFAYGLFNPLQSLWPQALFGSIKNSLGISLGMIGVGCVVGGIFANRTLSKTLSNKSVFFRLCVVLSLGELFAAVGAYSSNSFYFYSIGLFVSAAFMNVFEVGTFVKYISVARDDEKGAMTGFFQFIMRAAVFAGGGLYVLVADNVAVRLLPLIPLVLLAAAGVLMLFKKSSFQDI